MGCCKSKEKTTGKAAGLYKHRPHIMFIGPPSVGKSTLFFRTLIPGWTDITQSMEPTKAFYHEILYRGGMSISMWDFSGNPALQQSWIGLYRYVKMWAVVYVVALTDTSPERIAFNRAGIRSILSDDCLRDSAIVIVLNTFGMSKESLPVPPEEMIARLGLYEAEGALSATDRLAWYVVNTKEGERDEQWLQAFHFMLAHFAKMAAIKAEPEMREKSKTGGQGGCEGGNEDSATKSKEAQKSNKGKKKKK